ncbi:hypothetical protein A3Q56_07296 [Intoshia linei]|uniref:HTH CENPB-type domain-containing protein n=1 Tax=Intoshia linei TaxID=1819745 RepID=A0A177ASL8_9BILA|nr:hypothetical protein A3Q56_07296 [Intoshia linei]
MKIEIIKNIKWYYRNVIVKILIKSIETSTPEKNKSCRLFQHFKHVWVKMVKQDTIRNFYAKVGLNRLKELTDLDIKFEEYIDFEDNSSVYLNESEITLQSLTKIYMMMLLKIIKNKFHSDIKKNKQNIIIAFNENVFNGLNNDVRINNKSKNFDQTLITSLSKLRENNVPLSGIILKEQAILINNSNGSHRKNFKISDGRLRNFKKRHEITYKSLSGTQKANQSNIDDFFTKFNNKIIEYDLKDVFNADETALFYKKLPNKSYIIKSNDPRRKLKENKEKITVLLCCSAQGKKIKPLFIDKSIKPRCFSKINLNNQPFFTKAVKKLG